MCTYRAIGACYVEIQYNHKCKAKRVSLDYDIIDSFGAEFHLVYASFVASGLIINSFCHGHTDSVDFCQLLLCLRINL